MINFIKIIAFFSLSIVSCGGFQKVDTRKVPISGPERAKNIAEGRGVSLGKALGGTRGTNYEFSTLTNESYFRYFRFLPFTVDYSGGVIISDWYTDNSNKDQALKVTVRFLSNTVQSNSIKVTVHRKKCSVNKNCNVELFKSRIQDELIASILKKAAILEKQQKK